MKFQTGLFPVLQSQLPYQILFQKQDASCQVFIRKTLPAKSTFQSLGQQQFHNHKIVLSTAGEYVFEIDPITKEVKSCIKCDYEVKFWLIRAPTIIVNTVGNLKGIAFQFYNQAKVQTLLMFLDEEGQQDNTKKLQSFTSVLQKKYIVQKQFHQKYKAIKRIGKGVTASVYSSLCLIDKSQVAIKSFKKEVYFNQDNGNGKKSFLKEFRILTQLKCKYLAKLLGVYESEHSIYIVQQLLDRTLHSYLQKFGFPDTTQTRRLLYRLLIGLRYLHRKNIMHRDIKLQNILIRGLGKDNIEPVIVDLGLAEYQGTKDFVYIRCGTPGYVAPEVIDLYKNQKTEITYDKSCDIFSLGVIFHIFLLGRTVFQGEDMRQVVERNKQCLIDYEFTNYPRLAPQIKDILRGMLSRIPQKRYTVQQLMDHTFFAQQKIYFQKQVAMIDEQYFAEQKTNNQERKMKHQ